MELKDSLGLSEPYILHLPGEGKKYLGGLLKKLSQNQVSVSDDISVVTTATPDTLDRCPLVQQLEASGIPYRNSAESFCGEWHKTSKIRLISDALRMVYEPYTLLLDANDVALLKDIGSPFVSTWKRYDCDILFNGSQYLYPKVFAAPLEKERWSPYVNHYLNAGVCFGTTEKLLSLYETALYFSRTENYAPVDSEQYYIRIAIIENKDIRVKIDDGSHLFLTSHGN